MTKQDMINRLTNNERAFYFLSKDEKDFMRKWPHGVSVLDPRPEDDPFYTVSDPAFFGGGVYRINPAPHTPLNVPWGWLRNDIQYVAMDRDGEIYGYVTDPQRDSDRWLDGSEPRWISRVVEIDTTGIDWRTSLTKRPEVNE